MVSPLSDNYLDGIISMNKLRTKLTDWAIFMNYLENILENPSQYVVDVERVLKLGIHLEND